MEDIIVGVSFLPDSLTGVRLAPVSTSHALFGGGQQEELRLFVHLWRTIISSAAEHAADEDVDPLAQVLRWLPQSVPEELRSEAQQALQECLQDAGQSEQSDWNNRCAADSCVEAIVFRWLSKPLPVPVEADEVTSVEACTHLAATRSACTEQLAGHSKAVSCVCVCDRTVATGCNAGALALWSRCSARAAAPERLALHKRAHKGGVRALLWVQGNSFWSVGNDGAVREWDACTLQLLHELPLVGGSESLMSLGLVQQRRVKWIAAGDEAGAVHMLKLTDDQKLDGGGGQKLVAHSRAVLCSTGSVDGSCLFTGSADATVGVWCVDGNGVWRNQTKLEFHDDSVRCLGVVGDTIGSEVLVSSGADGAVCVCDFVQGILILKINCGTAAVTFMHCEPARALWCGSVDVELDNMDVRLADMLSTVCRTAIAVDSKQGYAYCGHSDGHLELLSIPALCNTKPVQYGPLKLSLAGSSPKKPPPPSTPPAGGFTATVPAPWNTPTAPTQDLGLQHQLHQLRSKLQKEEHARAEAEAAADQAKHEQSAANSCAQEQMVCMRRELEQKSQLVGSLSQQLAASVEQSRQASHQRQLEEVNLVASLAAVLQMDADEVQRAFDDQRKSSEFELDELGFCASHEDSAFSSLVSRGVQQLVEREAAAAAAASELTVDGCDQVLTDSLQSTTMDSTPMNWQFRWTSDGAVLHGPHTSHELLEWHEQGYFEHAAELQIRKLEIGASGQTIDHPFVFWAPKQPE